MLAFAMPGIFELLILGFIFVFVPITIAAVVVVSVKYSRNRSGANSKFRPCPGCGKSVSMHDNVCPQCGSPLPS